MMYFTKKRYINFRYYSTPRKMYEEDYKEDDEKEKEFF